MNYKEMCEYILKERRRINKVVEEISEIHGGTVFRDIDEPPVIVKNNKIEGGSLFCKAK